MAHPARSWSPRSLVIATAFALVPTLSACSATDDAPLDNSAPGLDAIGSGTRALLEVHALDLWAQALPTADRTLTIRRDGATVATLAGPRASVRYVELRAAGDYQITLSAPDFRDLSLRVHYDGGSGLDALSADAAGGSGQGVSVAHQIRTVSRRNLPVHSVYLGLRHLWFSAQGRPARRGNALRFMMDGEEAWGAVRDGLRGARDHVHAATWWWESNFELFRDPSLHSTLTEDARRPNTILALLEASPARKRVIVGEFVSQDGLLSTLSSDAPLRDHGAATGDNFEYMGQANETHGIFEWRVADFSFADRVRDEVPGADVADARFDADAPVTSEVPGHTVDLTRWPVTADIQAASWHQKFMVIDDRLAFIGGMNLKAVDWDTHEHRVFEPRRMAFSSSLRARYQVEQHNFLPDNGPRKDYMVRIEGPIVRDAADVFRRRWQHLLDGHVRYAEAATPFEVPAAPAPLTGGVMAQVAATMPAPFAENAIAETWFNAVANAREYIYIEDQYFRVPMLVEAILRRMEEVPSLRLVVITKPIGEWTDPGCIWTYRTHEMIRSRFPDRFLSMQLRSFDTQDDVRMEGTGQINITAGRFADIDTHAKILIVDDRFLSVGSANKNNRGIVYEGELTVAVLDRAWVRDARRRIFANLLPPGTPATDDVSSWWDQLSAAAAANDAVRARWASQNDYFSGAHVAVPAEFVPHGFVYTLSFRDESNCLFESISPDMT